jgi:DNA-binding CsgD family transcriptional regulator
VARSVAARLAGLPPEAVALAEAVATLGGRPEIHVAARVAGLGADDASRAADRLAQAGLLTPDRPVDFVHPLVEAAVRDALPAGARALAHQRAFDALVADGADPLVATPHLLRAEPRGRPETAALLARAAGDAMTRGDPAGAVALLRRALRESAGSRRDPELLAALGRAELAAGEPEGIDRLDEALAHCTVPRDRAALALAIAVARYDRGETALARRALAVGLREPLPEDDDARVSLLATDLTIRRSLVDPVHAVQPRAVAETLQRHGDGRSPVERLTLAHLAFRGLQTGALAHHAVVDLATRALPPPGGPPDPLDDLALPLAGMALYFSGAEPRAEEAFGAAGARAQGAGAPVAFATACFFRGSARYLMGQLQAAADDYDVALEAASERGWAHSLPSARALRALIAMEQDEPALADELLATLTGGDDRWSTHPTFPYALCVRGVRAVATGDPAGGLALLLRAGERQRELGLANPAVLHWQAEAAVAALAAGRPDDARPLADDLLARARRYGALRPLGIAERVAGLVHPGPSGLELLARSTVTLGASNARLELARSLLDLGCALRRSGARTDARETLRAAADEGERCGAVVLVTRATEELHLAGARPRRSRTSGPAALTSGERRVAALAAEGLTNREIAQRLFVTRRTVETHLTHVYGKLGTDRTGLRAALDADD